MINNENFNNVDSLPLEYYCFTYNENEMNEIFKLQCKAFYKIPAIIALILFASILSLIKSSDSKLLIGIVTGILCVHLYYYIRGFFTYKKNWKKGYEHVCKSVYEYGIYENYIDITIYRNNEIIRKYKCYSNEIDNIQILGNWLLIQFSGQLFIVRKSDLIENSAFYSYMYKCMPKSTEKPAPKILKIISNILCFTSFLSPLIFSTVALLNIANNVFNENMWLFCLFALIPISSVIYGVFLKSKGYEYKKNVKAGIIVAVILLIILLYTPFVFEP